MCDGHSNVPVDIGHRTIGVDGCIAPLVEALNDAGYRTLASCCGHGRQPANIPLVDLDGAERWLILTADRAEGERLMWPDDQPLYTPEAETVAGSPPPTPAPTREQVEQAIADSYMVVQPFDFGHAADAVMALWPAEQAPPLWTGPTTPVVGADWTTIHPQLDCRPGTAVEVRPC